MALEIRPERIDEPTARANGMRVLVDRVWPRDIRNSEAMIAIWLKEIVPNTERRRRFGHRPERLEGFVNLYAQELERDPAAFAHLRELMNDGRVTLLFAARDMPRDCAVALSDCLQDREV